MTDLAPDMARALDAADRVLTRHVHAVQHDTITAVLAEWLTGMPHLQWTRDRGCTGTAGITGTAYQPTIAARVAAITAYATTYPTGDDGATLTVVTGPDITRAEAHVMLAHIPVIVQTALWTRSRWWQRAPRRDHAEDTLANLVATLGLNATVHRRTP